MGYDLQPHIKLAKIDEIVLLSGNPDRVPLIASHLTNSEKIAEHRGLVAMRGQTPKNKKNVTILTTGMGAPSNAIVMEEAIKAGGRIFIRIGSCGSLQPEDKIGTIYIPYGAVRDERTSKLLVPIEYPAVTSPFLYQKLHESASELNFPVEDGLVWTSDIYYNPNTKYYKKWSNLGVKCVEMESSLIYSFKALYNEIEVASILTSDGNLNADDDIYSGDIDNNYKDFSANINISIDIVVHTIDNI